MKFNDKFFHFPPFLSVSWTHVIAVHYKNETLFIHLADGNVVSLQPMPQDIVVAIFTAHAAYLEKTHQQKKSEPIPTFPSLQTLLQSENAQGEHQVKFG